MNGASQRGFREVMETVHQVLRGQREVARTARELGIPERRLAVYASFVRQHVRTAVEKNHSVLAALLAGPLWEALLDGYFRSHPPTAYELNEAAAGFRDFLAAEATAGRLLPFHLELAELEWQEWVAYGHPARIPGEEEVTRPILNPTLCVLQFQYAVSGFVEAWREAEREGRPGRPEVPTRPSPETVLVFRDPASDLAHFYRASDALLFSLKVVVDGMDIPEAAAIAGVSESVVRDLLDRAASIGLIVLPRRDPDGPGTIPGHRSTGEGLLEHTGGL